MGPFLGFWAAWTRMAAGSSPGGAFGLACQAGGIEYLVPTLTTQRDLEAGERGRKSDLAVGAKRGEADKVCFVRAPASQDTLQHAAYGHIRVDTLAHELDHLIRAANTDHLFTQPGGHGTAHLLVAVQAVPDQG